MTSEFSFPDPLDKADFTRLIFYLDFEDGFELSLEAFLRLRRSLLQAAKQVPRDSVNGLEAEDLFEPPLANDPVARRRFQRPAPSFVLRPPLNHLGLVEAGETVPLEILFLGEGLKQIPLFVQVLNHLGTQGFFQGKGRYAVHRIAAVNASEQPQDLWHAGDDLYQIAPAVSNVKWWLESCRAPLSTVRLTFLTPTRLLSDGKPLFDPTFDQLFPFILRRVTSMLYAHCWLELVNDPAHLLECARTTTADLHNLHWEDWRTLSGRQDLGGILGSVTVEGPDLNELLWVLYLGALFQVGKGATYGAGYYQIAIDPD